MKRTLYGEINFRMSSIGTSVAATPNNSAVRESLLLFNLTSYAGAATVVNNL